MKAIIRTAIVFLIGSSIPVYLHAQTIARSTDTASTTKHTYTPIKPKGPKPISHELSVGGRINSDGWSGFVDIGRIKASDLKHSDMFYNIRYWEIEVTEKHSPKEYKTSDPGGNSYKYGKINNFYALKLGRGYAKMIAGKPDPGSVSIHWIYAGGFSLGMLKPYYLHVNSDPSAIKYTDATKQDFLNQQAILGSAGFGKGLTEMKYIPGVHLKSGLHFDFSANRTTVLGVETGVNFEYYSQEIQIMANQKATPYFADLYISLQVGKRS